MGKLFALDGFYKYPDGTVTPMPLEEFYEFDESDNLCQTTLLLVSTRQGDKKIRK